MEKRMTRLRRLKKSEAGLILLSTLLLLCAHLRIGYEVSAGDWVSNGVYSPFAVKRCMSDVKRTGEELILEEPALDEAVELRIRLTGRGYSNDFRELGQSLLLAVPGVERRYGVRVDGELVGYLQEESELGELIQVMAGEVSTPYTVAVNFREDITSGYCYVTQDTETDAMAVSKAIRDRVSVEVINMLPGDNDEVVYTSSIFYGPLVEA